MDRASPLELCRRCLAGGLAGLIFALAMFAASPVAHDLLHKKDAPQADDRCAVVLFAGGVSMPLGVIAVAAPAIEWRVAPVVAAAEIFVSSPRYLRQPERGPPVGTVA
jgi:hypothetical protein